MYLRFARDDFAQADGESPRWPFAPEEIEPWYGVVEKRLGISGAHDNVPWLPDSEIANILVPTKAETSLMQAVKTRWPGARPVLGRYAPPANTLEGAACTGRLALRPGAIVRAIEGKRGRVTGVRWHDQLSGSERSAHAPIVFLCASGLESTRILMLSEDANGRPIGAGSNALGHYLMDHLMVGAEGIASALPGTQPGDIEEGRSVYLARFDARESDAPKPGRGFGVQVCQQSLGRDRSLFFAASFGEMRPRIENKVSLNRKRVDRWGIPVLHIDCTHEQRELQRAMDQTAALRSLAHILGVSLTRIDETPKPPGSAVHECGTARMGSDPATSVLDPNNQCWDAAGLYVTDSASFSSQGSQNPTLTIMSLTARACAHAVR